MPTTITPLVYIAQDTTDDEPEWCVMFSHWDLAGGEQIEDEYIEGEDIVGEYIADYLTRKLALARAKLEGVVRGLPVYELSADDELTLLIPSNVDRSWAMESERPTMAALTQIPE